MVDARSALVAKLSTAIPPESPAALGEGNLDATTTAKSDHTHRREETVSRGSNALITIEIKGYAAADTEPTTTTDSIHNISCSVTLGVAGGGGSGSYVTRNLGNWISSTRTPVLQLSPVMQEIFGHRLTVSFQKSVVSISLVNTTFSDSGIYSCALGNTQKTDIDLRVTGGPFVVSRSFSDLVTVKEGDTSTFQMIACGNPKPTVKWALSNGSFSAEGVAVNGTYGYSLEHITRKYSLDTHCYKYAYETPKVYRQPCNLTAKFQVHGDSVNPITGAVVISVSFIPERVTDVRTKMMDSEQCMVTRWNGPLLNPNHCRIMIDYHVEVVRKTLPPVVFKTYSNNFMVCRGKLGIASMGEVLSVRVRYANKFGHGEYVPTTFVTDFAKKVEVVSLVEPAQNDDSNYKNIAITTSGLLGLFVLVIIVFITYYACANWNGSCCCCCSPSSVEDGLTDHKKINKAGKKYTVSKNGGPQQKHATTTPNTPSSSNKAQRKNRIRKETIIPKPRSLAQVTSHGIGLNKSHTFSGYDSFQNPHATMEEETLQKGYMPLNTLQRRISESLAAANAPPTRVSSIPVFEDIFENSHAEVDDDDDVDDGDDDFKRNSGASAETECTSLGSRTTLDNINPTGGQRNHHASLRHTHSLESSVSDYDMPYVVDLDKPSSVSSRRKQSLYDHLPRSQTFHGGARPSRFNGTESDDAMSQKTVSQYGSEYAHPSIALGNHNNNKDSTDTPPTDKRMSVYHTPRRSMLQLNVEDVNSNGNTGEGEETPKKKSSFTDDKVIYDKPKQVVTPQEQQPGTPTNSKPEGFAAPVISQITGLYDTPRIHAKFTPEPQDTLTTPTSETPNEGVSDTNRSSGTLEPPSNASSETLYDNINFILTKYGCSTTTGTVASATDDVNNKPSTNIYDQLPLSNAAADAGGRAKRGTEC